MKRIVFLTCIGSLTLALTALGAPKGKSAQRSAGQGARSAHVMSARGGVHQVGRNVGHASVSRDFSGRHGDRSVARANNFRSNRMARSRMESARIRNDQMALSTRAVARNNLTGNRQRNLTFANNVLANRSQNARITNYWRTNRFNNAKYAAFYNYGRRWHDRGWWNSHYSHIVFVLSGWWYWNAGYWYPAWGYDPYAWYSYDGPIYTG